MAELQRGDRQGIRPVSCWLRIPSRQAALPSRQWGHRALGALVLKTNGWKASEDIL